MQLTIGNEEAQRLASELALLTGESLTVAVTVALRERLARERRRTRRSEIAERLMAIGKNYAALPDATESGPDDVVGYDEGGAPR